MRLRAKPPKTLIGRAIFYAVVVGVLWSAYCLVWLISNHAIPEPSLFGFLLTCAMFVGAFFAPEQYWFRRNKPPEDD